MEWTTKQKTALEEKGCNLLVSAAAGSGKTTVLVERVIGLIEAGTDLSSMLIVTFTNAAAAEMKSRIARRLGYAAVSRCNISTFDKFAKEVYSRYYHVIGVKPGLKICDEYRRSILSEEALDELFEDRFNAGDTEFRAFLNSYCSSRDNRAAREMILEFHRFLQSLPDPEGWLLSAEKGEFFSSGKLFETACGFALADLKEAEARAEKIVSMLEDPLSSGFDLDPMPLLCAKAKLDLSGIQSVISCFENGNPEAGFILADELKFQVFKASKAESESYSAVKETILDVRDREKSLVQNISKNFGRLTLTHFDSEKALLLPMLSILCRLTADYDARFKAKKLEAGLMDFSDTAHYALKILEDPAVCAEYRDSFEYIFVDEYQDSNDVQEAMIRRIARGDNVFCVGDVKQSIYKFRLAEPGIFLKKYSEYKSGLVPRSKVVDLNENFRSRSSVIDFVNSVFSRIMTPETAEISYDDDAALKEGKAHPTAPLTEPQLWLVATSQREDEEIDPEIAELKAAELEAENAAEIIASFVGKPVFDGDDKPPRPLDYSDMVILLRSVKNKGEIYYQALTERNIPVFLERGEGYFDTPEIQAFLNLIRIVDNFSHDIPLISVMHFPAFGFTAEELARIRIFAGENSPEKLAYYEAVKLFEKGNPEEKIPCGKVQHPDLWDKLDNFLTRIESWRTAGMNLPLSDFVWQILCESGILAFASALPAGEQRAANLRAMVEKASSYEQQTAGGLSGFVSYIELIAAGDSKVSTGQAKMVSETDNVVRIMTIHKSKGLEFPFVLLAGLGDRFRRGRGGLKAAFHKELGAALRLSDSGKGIYSDPLSLKLIDMKKNREETAEIIRVLYVAMTRARDILVMSAAVKDPGEIAGKRAALYGSAAGASNYLSMILPSVKPECIHPVYLSERSAAAAGENSAKEELERAFDKGFELDEADLDIPMEELRRRLSFVPPRPEDSIKKKYSVSELAAMARSAMPGGSLSSASLQAQTESADYGTESVFSPEKTYTRPVFAAGERKLSASEKGTAYHTVMEHIPFTKEGKTRREIAAFIEDLKLRNILTEQEAKAVSPAKIEAFFKSELAERAMASPELHKEAPFVLKKNTEGRDVLIQGTIDCYFREGDQFVLLDYKSNYVDVENLDEALDHLRQSYLPQLELYREALERIEGKKVKEGYLYLFGTDSCLKI